MAVLSFHCMEYIVPLLTMSSGLQLLSQTGTPLFQCVAFAQTEPSTTLRLSFPICEIWKTMVPFSQSLLRGLNKVTCIQGPGTWDQGPGHTLSRG